MTLRLKGVGDVDGRKVSDLLYSERTKTKTRSNILELKRDFLCKLTLKLLERSVLVEEKNPDQRSIWSLKIIKKFIPGTLWISQWI